MALEKIKNIFNFKEDGSAESQSRRNFLVEGSAIAGGVAFALSPFSNFFTGTAHGEEVAEVAQRVEKASLTQEPTYEYINMDSPTSESDQATGVLEKALEYQMQGKAVIVNYTYEGLKESEDQHAFLRNVVPKLAKREQRGIALINAVAIRNNEKDEPEHVYLANLLGDLESNTLNRGEKIPFEDKEYVLPYGYIAIGGEKLRDFSFLTYRDDVPAKQVKRDVLRGLLKAFDESKDPVASNTRKEPLAFNR